MSNFKEKAIEISKKFPFSPFQSAAANGQNETGVAYLDSQFMKLLEQGAHLDTDRMPL